METAATDEANPKEKNLSMLQVSWSPMLITL